MVGMRQSSMAEHATRPFSAPMGPAIMMVRGHAGLEAALSSMLLLPKTKESQAHHAGACHIFWHRRFSPQVKWMMCMG